MVDERERSNERFGSAVRPGIRRPMRREASHVHKFDAPSVTD